MCVGERKLKFVFFFLSVFLFWFLDPRARTARLLTLDYPHFFIFGQPPRRAPRNGAQFISTYALPFSLLVLHSARQPPVRPPDGVVESPPTASLLLVLHSSSSRFHFGASAHLHAFPWLRCRLRMRRLHMSASLLPSSLIYGPSPCHVVFSWSNHPVILVSFYFVFGMSMFASICAPCLHHVVFATYKISFIGVSISLKRCFCQVQNLCDQRSSPPSRRFGELRIPAILDCVNFVVWHVRIPCQLRSIPVSRRLHMSASVLPCPCPL